MDASYWITGMIAMQDNSQTTTTTTTTTLNIFHITNKYTKSSLDYCVRRRRTNPDLVRPEYFEILQGKDCNLATPLGFLRGISQLGNWYELLASFWK